MILTCPPNDIARAIWIDLLQPTPAEIEQVRAATGLRVPTEGQISEIESSSRLAFEEGAFYLSTPLVAVEKDGTHVLTPVGFVYSSRVLVTVRFAPLAAMDAAHQQAAALRPKTSE